RLGTALKSILSLLGLATVGGVLVAAMIAPLVAVVGVSTVSAASIFDSLPTYIQPSQLSQRNSLYVKRSGGDVLLAEFWDQNRIEITLEEIGENVINAVISAEDPRFFSHNGADTRSLIRAGIGYITGDDAGGGSTLDMQYVRNMLVQQAEALGDEEG